MKLEEQYATTVEQIVSANPKYAELLVQILLDKDFVNQVLKTLSLKEQLTSQDGTYHNALMGFPIDTTFSTDVTACSTEGPSFAIFEVGCTSSVRDFTDYWNEKGYDSYKDYLLGILDNEGKGFDIYEKVTGHSVSEPVTPDIERHFFFGHIVRLLFPDSIQISVVWAENSTEGIAALPAELASEADDAPMRAFALSRDEIEKGQVENLLLGIARTGLERGGLSKVQGKITFSVSGYEDDPRELDEISEVRAYFHELDELMPFFLFYIGNENNGPVVRLFLGMFIDRKFFSDLNPPEEAKHEFINALLARLNAVADYCVKCSKAEGCDVDPVKTVYHTFRCCGMMIDRDEAKKSWKPDD